MQSPHYKRYQQEAVNLQQLKQQRVDHSQRRQKLDLQKNENDLLLSEVALLEEDCAIFKKNGSLMIKLDSVAEAKADIENKLSIISNQMCVFIQF